MLIKGKNTFALIFVFTASDTVQRFPDRLVHRHAMADYFFSSLSDTELMQ